MSLPRGPYSRISWHRWILSPIGSIGPTEYSVRPFSITAASPQHHRRYHRRALSIRTRLCPQHKIPPTRNKLFDTYSQALQCCFIICFILHVYIKCHWMGQRCITVHHRGSSSPWRCRRLPTTTAHHPQRTKSTRTTLTS